MKRLVKSTSSSDVQLNTDAASLSLILSLSLSVNVYAFVGKKKKWECAKVRGHINPQPASQTRPILQRKLHLHAIPLFILSSSVSCHYFLAKL